MKTMYTVQLLIFFLLTQFNNYYFIGDKDCFFNGLEYVKFPIEINSFSDYSAENDYGIRNYNEYIDIGIGYFDSKGSYYNATDKYSTSKLLRTHERYSDDKYEKYQKEDSIQISFIGKIKLHDSFVCLMVKIKVPTNFRSKFYYQILCFDSISNHLSTIKIFELIDETITKDWIQEKPGPNAISIIKKSGEIIVTWDEGNDVCEQFVELNDHGIFVETKLRFHNRKKFYEGNRNDYREVRNLNDLNFYK